MYVWRNYVVHSHMSALQLVQEGYKLTFLKSTGPSALTLAPFITIIIVLINNNNILLQIIRGIIAYSNYVRVQIK